MEILNYLNDGSVKRTCSLSGNIKKTNLFKNVNNVNTIDELVDKITKLLSEETDTESLNRLISENIYFLTNLNIKSVGDLLITTIENICKIYKKKIEKLCKNGDLTIKEIVNIWNMYLEKTSRLYNILWYFNKRFINKKNKLSFLKTIVYFIFYTDIVNVKYQNNGDDKFLIEYLGDDICNIKSNDINYMIGLFDMYKCFTQLQYIFNIDGSFNNLFDKRIIDELNSNDNFSLNLVQYIDRKIKYMKPTTQYNTNKAITEAFYITKYIDETNLESFKKYYCKYLSFRLLGMKNVNLQFESILIDKLSFVYGKSFTHTMLSILDDIRKSRDLITEYKQLKIQVQSDKFKNIDFSLSKFNTNVLRSFLWKNINQTETKYNLPVEANIYTEIFEKFHKKIFEDRTLAWNFNMGESVITFNGLDRQYNLKVSTCQMIIIMAFNNHDGITIDKLQELTNIEKYKLVFYLDGLVKSGIIIKNGETYSYNKSFMSEHVNISLLKYLKNMPKKKYNTSFENQNMAFLKRIMKHENTKQNKKLHTYQQKYDLITQFVEDFFIKSPDEILETELSHKIKNKFTFNINNNLINTVLLCFLSKGYLSRLKDDENIYYKLLV